MYALLVFVLLLVSVLIASAGLAWPLQTLLTLWFEPEFESVISRTVLGLGILVFLAVFRKAGFSSWRDIGFGPGPRQFWGDAARGFAQASSSWHRSLPDCCWCKTVYRT